MRAPGSLALLPAILVAVAIAACGGDAGGRTIDQDQLGSTEAAAAAVAEGAIDCGGYAVPRRMTQYVNEVEADALPDFAANPIDSACRFTVATMVASLPTCETGSPEDASHVEALRQRVNQALESGLPPDQAYARIRDEAREIASRKAC